MTVTATTTASTTTSAPHAPVARPSLRGHVAIMRIDHWVKQVFVLPGIAIALTSDVTHITNRAWWTVPLGFVAVCLVSSSNYVINEVLDHTAVLSTVVNRFDVPFSHLVTFFIKAVFAAIPALIVLSVLLYLGGNVLKAMYPELIHMQILVTFPN